MDPSVNSPALGEIEWPFRILITGPSESGKTTAAMKIMKSMKKHYDRLVVVSPTFSFQSCFRSLDSLISSPKRDIFPLADKRTFGLIGAQLKTLQLHCEKRNEKQVRTLIFLDDNTSNNAIHGGRSGALGNLAATCRHYGASLLCISHQGKAITPGFRNNTTGLIAFPTTNRNEVSFITSEFGNPIEWSDETFKQVIACAWKGGRQDRKEWGKHFLFVLCKPRESPRYFIDFETEVEPCGDEGEQ